MFVHGITWEMIANALDDTQSDLAQYVRDNLCSRPTISTGVGGNSSQDVSASVHGGSSSKVDSTKELGEAICSV